MNLICKIKGHKWKYGRCERCNCYHGVDEHNWVNGVCSVCGKNVLDEITSWHGSNKADNMLEEISSDVTAESRNTLIYIALNLLGGGEGADYNIGKKAAALVTDDALLLQRFSSWAQGFKEAKLHEEWECYASLSIAQAFAQVSCQTRQEMNAILKPHLIQIALNAQHPVSVRSAIYQIESMGALSDDEAKRFIPLAENSEYVFRTVRMLMSCSPIWKTLLTKDCISTLGGIMKGDGERRWAAELMKEIYHAGCQRDAIRKYNGTVIREASYAPTDDDNYGIGSRDKEKFLVF